MMILNGSITQLFGDWLVNYAPKLIFWGICTKKAPKKTHGTKSHQPAAAIRKMAKFSLFVYNPTPSSRRKLHPRQVRSNGSINC
jgi:hypothetical protein